MCNLSGSFRVDNAAELTARCLHAGQHRAVDYAGMATFCGDDLRLKHGTGIARQVFTKDVLEELPGDRALGHIRYPTVVDNKKLNNIQPIVGDYGGIPMALAHNGNLTNLAKLRSLIDPSLLKTSMDTEIIVRLLEKACTGNIVEDIASVFGLLEGSITIGILLPDRLIAVRDQSGNRPLSVARLNGGYCISSETCAFPSVGATDHFDVEPGTIVSITKDGISTKRFADEVLNLCIFELIYYSLPTSIIFGQSVSRFRMKIGQALAKKCPVIGGADIVTAVPDSSNHMAIGYAQNGNSGQYFPLIIRNHYVGRTFIAATQAQRDSEVSQKFSFDTAEIRGKRIVVVDDSIVRGTTLPVIVGILRRLGAKAVHVRIGSPPIKYTCKYGINTPTEKELISSSHSPEEIRALVGADSLEFLPLEALKALVPDPNSFCFACMNGKYWHPS